jgi:hypothetical protein
LYMGGGCIATRVEVRSYPSTHFGQTSLLSPVPSYAENASAISALRLIRQQSTPIPGNGGISFDFDASVAVLRSTSEYSACAISRENSTVDGCDKLLGGIEKSFDVRSEVDLLSNGGGPTGSAITNQAYPNRKNPLKPSTCTGVVSSTIPNATANGADAGAGFTSVVALGDKYEESLDEVSVYASILLNQNCALVLFGGKRIDKNDLSGSYAQISIATAASSLCNTIQCNDLFASIGYY